MSKDLERINITKAISLLEETTCYINTNRIGGTSLLSDIRDFLDNRIVKKCHCGREYNYREWKILKLSNIICSQQYNDYKDGEPDIELRDCICGSTIGIEIRCPHDGE